MLRGKDKALVDGAASAGHEVVGFIDKIGTELSTGPVVGLCRLWSDVERKLGVRYCLVELVVARHHVDVDVGTFGSRALHANNIGFHFLPHPVLQFVHGGFFTASHSAPSFTDFTPAAPLILAGVEVCASQVGGSVVVRTIRLMIATRLAGREWHGRAGATRCWIVLAYPNPAIICVMTFDVSA